MLLISLFLFLFLLISTIKVHFLFWIIIFTNILFSGFMTIFAVSPINSLFFLIALFLNTSIALFSLNLVYLGLILIIVYVGALSIFFLFTIMLLNVNTLFVLTRRKKYITKIFDIIFFFLLFSVIVVFLIDFYFYAVDINDETLLLGSLFDLNNAFFNLIDLYAHMLYTVYGVLFIFLGLFLFIIMIGIIVLIQEPRILFNKQNENFLFEQPIASALISPNLRNHKGTFFFS